MGLMASDTHRRVAILGGNRIPFARSDGAYANASNQDMFTAALGGLIDRFNLDGQKLDAVIGGAEKCLRAGEFCAHAFDSQYRRYRYRCIRYDANVQRYRLTHA